MIRLIKVVLLAAIVLFTLALISPVKAVYTVNITSVYSYIAVSEIGNVVINLALQLRSVF